jgi:hypothetical protein
MPHCYNAHVFLTLGDIPSINTHTYAQVRNRVCSDGSEWLNIPMKNFLSNRLDDANYEFNNIEKLEMNVKRINSIYSNALFRKIQKLTGRFHNEGK